VDLSLHKRSQTPRNRLKQVVLFGLPDIREKLLMDVNKARELRDSFAWA
jgi:hypothetical protein